MLHLTVKFLGEVEASKIDPIRNAVAAIAHDTPMLELRIAGFGAFPNRFRPRVLWLGIEEKAEELVGLHWRLNRALGPLGFKPDSKGFTPHLTIGRARRRTDKSVQDGIAAAAQQIEVGVLGSVDVSELVFYKSSFRATGPVHEVIDRFHFDEG